MTLKLTKPTLLLEGGPWDGYAYHLEDWQKRLACERFETANGSTRVIAAHYVNTGRKEIHPRTGATRGGQLSERWEWRGPVDAGVEPARPAPKKFVPAGKPNGGGLYTQSWQAFLHAGARGLTYYEFCERLPEHTRHMHALHWGCLAYLGELLERAPARDTPDGRQRVFRVRQGR